MPSRLLTGVVTALVAGLRRLVALLQRRARLPLLTEVLQHWVRERRTLQQGIFALSVGLSITLAAGLVLGAMDELVERLPGLLILAPAAIGMRGAIFAALAARLGTGMLTGQLDQSRDRRSFLGQNLESAVILSTVTGVALALATMLVGGAVGVRTIAFTDLVLVSMIGTALSSVVVMGVVLLMTSTAQRQSWDMDAIGTPIISATADISTLPALVVGTFALGNEVVSAVLGWGLVACAVAAVVIGLRNKGDLVQRVVRESLPILTYTTIMGVLAGTVLETRKEDLVSSPALLVAIPPFISSCGAIGGILSARLSSALHLGLLDPTPFPRKPAWMEGSLSLLFAVLGYLAVAVLAWAAAALLGYPGPSLPLMVGILMVAGALAVLIIFAVGYSAATASFRFGLDPDNVSIPMVTSTMDFAGILCLVAGIVLLQGG